MAGGTVLSLSFAPVAGNASGTVALATAPTAAAAPADTGEWSAPFYLGGPVIHAVLTHTNDILFMSDVEGSPLTDNTSLNWTWNYQTGTRTLASTGYDRDFFCAAHNILADGRVFVSGGHDYGTSSAQDAYGVAETDLWNPTTRQWQRGPVMGQKRWYPTNVGLPNGKTLIFGGQAAPGVSSNTVDEYDATTNTMRRLPSSATKAVGTSYPKLNLLADGRIVKTGAQRMAAAFNPATNSWTNIDDMLFGFRQYGNAVLLPGGQKILAVGGQTSSSAAPTRTAEILDMSAASPQWRYTGSLSYARLHANTVILPDGQLLIVGGGTWHKYAGPVRTAELYDPDTGTWTPMATQQASRIYHSVALLLPDGRVLSAGQDYGSMQDYGEIYSPPYLFKGARPTISSAPSTAAYGSTVSIGSAEATGIRSVSLIHPGSVTHDLDAEQRMVPLSFTASGSTISATVPTNRNLLPPGYYMLFIVNSDGVPSVARWVRVT